jgi:hypothetical protein
MNKNKDLRSFGLIWSAIFLIIAVFPLSKGGEVKLWSVYVSLFFFVVSILYPRIYSATCFYQGWIKFGEIAGKINSKIISCILFYFLFLPIGTIIKICGKDLLNKKIDKSATSYFIDRKDQIKEMENQF